MNSKYFNFRNTKNDIVLKDCIFNLDETNNDIKSYLCYKYPELKKDKLTCKGSIKKGLIKVYDKKIIIFTVYETY